MSQHIMERFKERFEGSPVERARWQLVFQFVCRYGVMADWKFAVIVGAGGKLVIDEVPRTFLAPHMAAGEGLAELWLETVEAMIARFQNGKELVVKATREVKVEKPKRVKRTRQTKGQKELLLLVDLLGQAKDGLTLAEIAHAMEVSVIHARHLVIQCDECWVNGCLVRTISSYDEVVRAIESKADDFSGEIPLTLICEEIGAEKPRVLSVVNQNPDLVYSSGYIYWIGD